MTAETSHRLASAVFLERRMPLAMTSMPGALGITMERRYRKRVGMRRKPAMTKPSGAKRHYDMPLPAKQQRRRQTFGGPARAAGIGPNKACGHKGGIRRQGSKRG